MMATVPAFQDGLRRLLKLAAQQKLVIMCSEGDHQQCHRALLLTPQLMAKGARVVHILPDGGTEEAQEKPKQLTLF